MLYGADCVLSYKAGGLGGGGAWVVLANTRNVTLNLEKSEFDATTRASSKNRDTKTVIKDATIELEFLSVSADAGYTALQSAYANDSALAIKVEDADSQGFQMDVVISSWSRSEALEEGVLHNLTFKQTYIDTLPSWLP